MPAIIESAEWIEGAVRVSMDLYRTRVRPEQHIVYIDPYTHHEGSRVLQEVQPHKPKRISNLYMLAAKEKEIRDKS